MQIFYLSDILRTKYLLFQTVSMSDIRILDFVTAIFLGIGLGFVTVVSWTEMPEFRLWASIDYSIPSIIPNSTLFGLIHLLIGGPFFIFGMYNVVEIVRINQIAQGGKNNPIHLLTGGFYNKVRHPMTGMFIIILTGVMISLCSSLGLVLIALFILFFHGTTLYEEKTWLIPRFGQEYLHYMNEVPRRYFTSSLMILLILILIFSSIGIIL